MFARILIVAVLAPGLLASVVHSEPITPEQARQAAKRAIPVLLEGGYDSPKAEVKGKGCMSCHWSGSAILSLNAAQRAGLVDRKELERFDGLLKKQSTKTLVYQLSGSTMEVVKKAGVPENKLADLKKIGDQRFTTPQNLQRELAKFLSAEALEKNQKAIIQAAANPNYYDTVARLMSASILMAGAAANTPTPPEVSRGLVEQLLGMQHKDGYFEEPGQPFFPCDPKELRECCTIWSVLALHTVEPKSEAVSQALDRGTAFLKKTKPGTSIATLALRALLANRLKDTRTAGEFAAELLKRQGVDGGWSSWDWSKKEYESDAWATGLVLYTLGILGRDHTDAAVQRAWAFLIEDQDKTGEWTVTNAKGKAARIWSLWGTGWAVVGLLATAPK